MGTPVSLTYTADTYWREALRDLPDEAAAEALAFEKYNLINRSQQLTQAMFADLVAEAYMDTTVLSSANAGQSGTTEGAVWDADDSTLSDFLGLSFTSADVGKTIIFVDSATDDVYIGTIQTIVNALSIVIGGYSLPTTAIMANIVVISGSSVTADAMTITTLPMLRYGNQLRLWITSSLATNMLPIDYPALQKWRTSANQNVNTIAWSLVGNVVYFKKGDSLSSYGTLSFNYPRVVIPVTSVQTTIDLLDGAMAQIGIKVLRNMIASRVPMQRDIDKELGQIKELVYSLYKSFGQNVAKEQVEQKVEALL